MQGPGASGVGPHRVPQTSTGLTHTPTLDSHIEAVHGRLSPVRDESNSPTTPPPGREALLNPLARDAVGGRPKKTGANFAPVSIGKAREALLNPLARDAVGGRPKKTGENFSAVSIGEVRDVASRGTGYSFTTLRKVEQVQTVAENPDVPVTDPLQLSLDFQHSSPP